MKTTSGLFHYSKLNLYYQDKYDGIFLETHISGDEIAIKDEDGRYDYYIPLKKDKVNYLLPSHWQKELPLKVTNAMKIPFKNKAYMLIENVKSVRFGSKKTMEYDEYIDAILPYKHMTPNEWTVWKIITDVAYRNRINIRAISYPGWGKDSPLVILSLLRMDVASADKPSYPKLKWMLYQNNKIIGLNEVQNIMSEDKRHMAKFYETTGAFEPFVIFDKRGTGGTGERAELENVSSLTYYNVPKDDHESVFDDVFDPKVIGRVFPVYLTGGDHKITALKENFSEHVTHITKEESEIINELVKNNKHYEDNWYDELKASGKLGWKLSNSFKNNRWQRNYVTICNGLKMYARTEDEFRKLEETFYTMHTNYNKFLQERSIGV